jgi:hypothetical protein
MSIGASCVRGNWEDRTLLAYNSLTAKVHPLPGPQEDPHTQEDFLDEESFSHGDYKDRALAKLLSKDHVKWLQKCPVILRVGALPGFNGGSELTVVHAGLVPGVALERQDPFFVMNMRSMDLNTQVPSEDRKGKEWDKVCSCTSNSFAMTKKKKILIVSSNIRYGITTNLTHIHHRNAQLSSTATTPSGASTSRSTPRVLIRDVSRASNLLR